MQTGFFSTLTGQIVLAIATGLIGSLLFELMKSTYGRMNNNSRRNGINYIKNNFRQATYCILYPDSYTHFLLEKILYCIISLGTALFGLLFFIGIRNFTPGDITSSRLGYFFSNFGFGIFFNITLNYWFIKRRLDNYHKYYDKTIKKLKKYNAPDSDIKYVDELYHKLMNSTK